MAKSVDPQELRGECMGMTVYVSGGRGVPQGQRFLYLSECDGLVARVYDSLGRPFRLALYDFKLLEVHDIEGTVVPHRVNADNGHLEVRVGDLGWRSICPWGRASAG